MLASGSASATSIGGLSGAAVQHNGGLSQGAKEGLGIGLGVGLAALIALVVAAVLLMKRRRSRAAMNMESGEKGVSVEEVSPKA